MTELIDSPPPLSVAEIRRIYAFVPYRDAETSVNYIDFANAVAAAAFARGVAARQPEIDALRARIRAMEEQEPVAWADPSSLHDLRTDRCSGIMCGTRSNLHERTVPLYTAPGAKNE